MRKGPDRGYKRCRAKQEDEKRQAHFAIEKNEKQTGQKKQSAPPEVGAAAARQFFLRKPSNAGPGVLIDLALPTVVAIFELLVVIVQRRLRTFPQEQPHRSIGPRVQYIRKEERVSREPPVVVAHEPEGQRQDNSQRRENVDDAGARRHGGFCFAETPQEGPAGRRRPTKKSFLGPSVGQDMHTQS